MISIVPFPTQDARIIGMASQTQTHTSHMSSSAQCVWISQSPDHLAHFI